MRHADLRREAAVVIAAKQRCAVVVFFSGIQSLFAVFCPFLAQHLTISFSDEFPRPYFFGCECIAFQKIPEKPS